jgi:DNA-binding NarL/FixJ family response regulator
MITVLLIESEPAHLIGMALILRCFGHNVLEADSADEAVRNCQEHLGPIHVVVTKAILDDENAGDVVARLESIYPQIRAVLISDEPADELAVANNSGCAFLRTPFPADALDDTITRLLDGPKKRAASVEGVYGSATAGKICLKIMTPRLRPSSMPIRSFSQIALAPLPAPVGASLKWPSITIALAAGRSLLAMRSSTCGLRSGSHKARQKIPQIIESLAGHRFSEHHWLMIRMSLEHMCMS